jgi:glutathione S-transferase
LTAARSRRALLAEGDPHGTLAGRRFVAGDDLTVADFSIGAWMNYSQMAGYPLGGNKHVVRWHADLMELPAWRASIVAPPS